MKVTCAECSARVEPEEFCPECGALLPQLYQEQGEKHARAPFPVRTRVVLFLLGFAFLAIAVIMGFLLGGAG